MGNFGTALAGQITQGIENLDLVFNLRDKQKPGQALDKPLWPMHCLPTDEAYDGSDRDHQRDRARKKETKKIAQ